MNFNEFVKDKMSTFHCELYIIFKLEIEQLLSEHEEGGNGREVGGDALAYFFFSVFFY